MNLAIIGAGESSRIKAKGWKRSKHMVTLNGECIMGRTIRIARAIGTRKVYCIINSHEPELKNYLLTTNFGLLLELTIQDTPSSMHSLFALAPYLMKESFCLVTVNSVFPEREFSEFINYSLLNNEIDGTLAITRYIDDEKPLCVAMNEEDIIMKFSDSKDGYNWATGGVYFLSPRIFDVMEYALEIGIYGLRNFLRLLVAKDYILKGYSFSKIVDVDHVSDIRIAEQLIRQDTCKRNLK